ncbi:hypothetical protein D3C86_1991210 [compost metagenome]
MILISKLGMMLKQSDKDILANILRVGHIPDIGKGQPQYHVRMFTDHFSYVFLSAGQLFLQSVSPLH